MRREARKHVVHASRCILHTSMTNHFTDLGFDVVEATDLTDLLLRAAGTADEFPLDSGRSLLRWAVGAGIEFWIQVNPFGELVGVHPFFLGPTRLNFRVTRVDVQTGAPQDGSLMGWVAPELSENNEIPGAYPLRLDLPAYPLGTDGLDEGAVTELQVAAFAEEIALYADEAEFNAAQDSEAQFAIQSFVPIGLLPPDGDDDFNEEDAFGESLLRPDPGYLPAAEALFSGTILRSER